MALHVATVGPQIPVFFLVHQDFEGIFSIHALQVLASRYQVFKVVFFQSPAQGETFLEVRINFILLIDLGHLDQVGGVLAHLDSIILLVQVRYHVPCQLIHLNILALRLSE